jgi:hypothetical protein
MSMSKEMAACLDPRIEHYMRQQRGMCAQLDARANHHVSPDVRSLADDRRRVDHRCRMNARRINRRLIEEAQSPRKSVVRVINPQSSRLNLRKLRFHQHGGRFGGARQAPVLGIGHEGNLRRAGLLNPFHARHFQLRVSAQLRTQLLCQLA